jgi:hypothetical protein
MHIAMNRPNGPSMKYMATSDDRSSRDSYGNNALLANIRPMAVINPQENQTAKINSTIISLTCHFVCYVFNDHLYGRNDDTAQDEDRSAWTEKEVLRKILVYQFLVLHPNVPEHIKQRDRIEKPEHEPTETISEIVILYSEDFHFLR